MALINCPKCGAMISDKAEKCIKCGNPMKEITTNVELSEKDSNNTIQIINNNAKTSGKKKIIICSIILLVVITIIVSIFIIKPTGKDSNSSGATDEVAQKMVDDINAIGDVTLDDEELITKLVERYNSLTDEQKKQVNNYATLLNASDKLDTLVKEDNKPINLSTANAEEYLKINAYSQNYEETVRPGLGWKDYYYYFDLACDVSAKKNYYFENVNMTIKIELVYGGLTAEYEIDLNDSGVGSFSKKQEYKAAYKFNDYRRYFSVNKYEITKISGKVYKRKQ